MDILGIGGWEFVAILIIMLVVAGPKRMIQWSYTLGRYVSMLRKMWAETAVMLQKEFDEAGVDVKVPTTPPTRGSLRREVNKAFSGLTKPLQDVADEVKTDLEPIREATAYPRTLNKPVTRIMPEAPPPPPEASNGNAPEAAPPAASDSSFGTWSGEEQS
jgi:Sec-independent protein translocase protein TatA